MGEARIDIHLRADLFESLHQRDRLGGRNRTRLQEARLRILGWRPYVPHSTRCPNGGYVDGAEPLRSPGQRPPREKWLLSARPRGPQQKKQKNPHPPTPSPPPPPTTPSQL